MLVIFSSIKVSVKENWSHIRIWTVFDEFYVRLFLVSLVFLLQLGQQTCFTNLACANWMVWGLWARSYSHEKKKGGRACWEFHFWFLGRSAIGGDWV